MTGGLIIEAIFCILMMVVFGWWFYNFVIWPQQDQKRKETAKKLESCVTYDPQDNTLKLHQFHPDICKVVKMEPYEIPHTSYKPDSVTYTSVTVGQVTTGGVTHNEGYQYISGHSKTGKYKLSYMGKTIEHIELCTPEVKQRAQAQGMQAYMDAKGQIEVVQHIKVSQVALQMALQGVYSAMAEEMAPGYPSESDCRKIYNFLCSGN